MQKGCVKDKLIFSFVLLISCSHPEVLQGITLFLFHGKTTNKTLFNHLGSPKLCFHIHLSADGSRAFCRIPVVGFRAHYVYIIFKKYQVA
jgi:hypothetical protein